MTAKRYKVLEKITTFKGTYSEGSFIMLTEEEAKRWDSKIKSAPLGLNKKTKASVSKKTK